MERFSGPALRAARERAGKSREQLAVDIDRSYQSIINYERRGMKPSTEVLPKLAVAVGVKISDLFEDIEVAS